MPAVVVYPVIDFYAGASARAVIANEYAKAVQRAEQPSTLTSRDGSERRLVVANHQQRYSVLARSVAQTVRDHRHHRGVGECRHITQVSVLSDVTQ